MTTSQNLDHQLLLPCLNKTQWAAFRVSPRWNFLGQYREENTSIKKPLLHLFSRVDVCQRATSRYQFSLLCGSWGSNSGQQAW